MPVPDILTMSAGSSWCQMEGEIFLSVESCDQEIPAGASQFVLTRTKGPEANGPNSSSFYKMSFKLDNLEMLIIIFYFLSRSELYWKKASSLNNIQCYTLLYRIFPLSSSKTIREQMIFCWTLTLSSWRWGWWQLCAGFVVSICEAVIPISPVHVWPTK